MTIFSVTSGKVLFVISAAGFCVVLCVVFVHSQLSKSVFLPLPAWKTAAGHKTSGQNEDHKIQPPHPSPVKRKWSQASQSLNTSFSQSTSVISFSNNGDRKYSEAGKGVQRHYILKTLPLPISGNNAFVSNPQKHTFLTLFTSLSDSPLRDGVNNNTIHNWRLLSDLNVTAVLFTNSTRTGNLARQVGWIVLPILHEIPKDAGTPILPKLFQQARASLSSDFYGYANGDILFDNSLVDTIKTSLRKVPPALFQKDPVLITGRRTNVLDITPEEAVSWTLMRKAAVSRGKLFILFSEDYFITNRDYPWETYPPVAVGVRAFDNFLVLRANELHHTTIDATRTILAVHQNTREDQAFRNIKRNYNYNAQLLAALYGKIDYDKGKSSCCHYMTYHRDIRTIVVYKRPLMC